MGNIRSAESDAAKRAAVLAAQNLFGDAARAVSRNRRQKIVFVFLTIAITVTGAAFARYLIAPTHLVFATGPKGSSSYEFAEKLQAVLKSRAPLFGDRQGGLENNRSIFGPSWRIRIDIAPQETFANVLQTFAQHKAHLAIIRTDTKVPPRTRAIAQIEHSVLLVGVPKSAKTKTIAALKGKRVAVIANDARDMALVRQILSFYDLPAAQIETAKPDDWAKLFEAGGPAAVFFMARKSGLAADRFWVAKGQKANFELIEPDGVKALAERIRGVKSETLEAGAISPSPQIPDDDVETLSVDDLLVTHSGMTNAIASQLTAAIIENKDQLGLPGRYAVGVEPPNTDKDALVLAHPGAAEYVDDDTKTFFDRYSDVIYLGMSLASVVGSIFLGLYSTVTRVSPVQAGQLTEALMALTERAKEAQDAASLTTIEAELNDILSHVLAGLRDGSVASDGFDAFRLTFDLARDAIAARARALGDASPPAVDA